MGRPVITRAIKRTRHFLAGNVDGFNAANLESMAAEVAIDFAEKAAAKLAQKIKSRVAKSKAAKAPADDTQ